MRLRRFRNRSGFTLIEILAVVVILGILAVVVVPRVLASSATAKINSCYQNKAAINTGVEKWYFDNGTWPTDNLADISADVNYFPDGIPTCPVDGSAYDMDPLVGNNRVAGHTH